MAFNPTALAAYIKRKYQPDFIENSLSGTLDQALAALKSETDGSGSPFQWLVDAADSFNGSASFSVAQTAATNNANTVGSQFSSTWNAYSAVAQLTSEVIGITRNDDGAWQKAMDTAMKKTKAAIDHANAVFLQGYGWGEVSTIASVSTVQFTPGIASDITKYVVGMPLVFSQSIHGHVLRSATVVYVSAVNYSVGSELVTCSADIAALGAVNGDTAFIAGCRENSATPTKLVPTGLNAIVPDQSNATDMADSSITTSFLGVNRSSNSRLYGVFVDLASGGSVLDGLIDGTQEAITIGNAKRLECFCSKTTFANVAKDLHASIRYQGNPADKSIGTKRLMIYADGQAEAYLNVSRTTNDTMIWGFDPTSFVKKSIGAAPHIENEDGLTISRIYNSAGWEVRWFQQMIYMFKNLPAMLRVQLV